MRSVLLILIAVSLVSCSAPKPPSTAHKHAETLQDCTDCPQMVVVPSGSFTMGSPATEPGRFDDEGPQHSVTLQSFAVGTYEVTFEEWDACVADGGCDRYRPDDLGWGRGRRPVINVTWDHAQAYVLWLSKKTGHRYRLLSEAEWEYAARAGTQTAWYWGDEQDKACQYANGADRAARSKFDKSKYRTIYDCDDGAVFTAPVGQYRPNQFGLYDMIGNVWEWVEDCPSESYANAPSDGSASTRQDCQRRVLRAGSWDDEPFKSRAADRFDYWFGTRNYATGFRVARTL